MQRKVCLSVILSFSVSVLAAQAFASGERSNPRGEALVTLVHVKDRLKQLETRQSFLSGTYALLNLIEIVEGAGVLTQNANIECDDRGSCSALFHGVSSADAEKKRIALSVEMDQRENSIHVHAILPYEVSAFSVYAREFDATFVISAGENSASMKIVGTNPEDPFVPPNERMIEFESSAANAKAFIYGDNPRPDEIGCNKDFVPAKKVKFH